MPNTNSFHESVSKYLQQYVISSVVIMPSLSDNEPPRVVLESTDNKSYTIREAKEGGRSYSPPPTDDEMMPQR